MREVKEVGRVMEHGSIPFGFEDKGRGHKPRNTGNLQKLEKSRT